MVTMKQSKKVLPIQKMPYIRSYTWHAFLHAIAGNEMFAGDKVASFSLVDNNAAELKSYGVDAHAEAANMKYEIFTNSYACDPRYYLYRRCMEEDEIMMNIDFFEFVNQWGQMGLFLKSGTDTMEEYLKSSDEESKKNIDCGGVHTGKGFFTEIANEYTQGIMWKPNYQTPCRLKITYQRGKVSFYGSLNEGEWTLLGENAIEPANQKELYIGVRIAPESKDYYNWLYSNYIQLRGSLLFGTPLDYSTIPMRDANYYTVNPCVVFQKVNYYLLLENIDSFWSFIKDSINNNRYIEVILEEKYLPGYWANGNQESRYHQNLIYGYDDENEKVMLLGVDTNGYPINNVAEKENFFKALEAYPFQTAIYTLEYMPDEAKYPLDVKQIVKGLDDFLTGRNNSDDCGNTLKPIECAYGVDIYDEFIKKDDCERFTGDFRIAFTLREHKKIMIDRVQFLIDKKILCEEETEEIRALLEEIRAISETVLILVLKNKGRPVKNLKERVVRNLERMKELEIQCYGKLRDLLKKKEEIIVK